MKKILWLVVIFIMAFSCSALSESRYEMGIKMLNIRDEVAGGYNLGFLFDYADLSMDLLVVRGFGFLSILDLSLRFPWFITPTIGVGLAWGNHFWDGPFVDTEGVFVGAGLQYVNEGYTFSLGGKTYVTWSGGISNFPIIEASFRIKVGEW